MSKYSQEYYHLSKEYLDCKKEILPSLGLLLVFVIVPVSFRFLVEDDYIFNIPKEDYISLTDFFSVIGILVSFFQLLTGITRWIRIRNKIKNLIN